MTTDSLNQVVASTVMKSPVGPLTLLATGEGLAGVYFEGRYQGEMPGTSNEFIDQAKRELEEYFARQRQEFTVALDPDGTEFQRDVWKALGDIPYGKTRSYKEIAQRINRPKSVRAVGMANGANPISIIVPCHRVIGASGDMVGYGGGLGRKRMLLALEGVTEEDLF